MKVYRKTYTDQAGKRRRQERYTVDYVCMDGSRRRVAAFRDREASLSLARRIKELVSLQSAELAPTPDLRRYVLALPSSIRNTLARQGLVSVSQMDLSEPLSVLMERFRRTLENRDRTDQHVGDVCRSALRVLHGSGAKFWSQIQPESVEEYLASERARQNVSPRRCNFLAGSARQFTRWVHRSGLASEDPLRSLRPLSVEADRRRVRRAFTVEEINQLVSGVESGDEAYGMSGPERAAAYLLAVETGLRKSELASLRCASVDVDELVVRLDGSSAKNRRGAVLPLRHTMVDRLRAVLAGKSANAIAFPLPHPHASAAMLKGDLRSVGIARVDDAGRVLDWHSFRYSTATILARQGVPVAVVQRILRHSTVHLTLSVYAQLGVEDQRAAIDQMPSFDSKR